MGNIAHPTPALGGPKAVLDACVLYPTVLRELLQGAGAAGLYQPVFSDRILREWVLATAKLGPEAPAIAAGEAASLRAAFPRGLVAERKDIEARLLLPDPNDTHVLATAIASGADLLVTFNAQDFPGHVLAAAIPTGSSGNSTRATPRPWPGSLRRCGPRPRRSRANRLR